MLFWHPCLIFRNCVFITNCHFICLYGRAHPASFVPRHMSSGSDYDECEARMREMSIRRQLIRKWRLNSPSVDAALSSTEVDSGSYGLTSARSADSDSEGPIPRASSLPIPTGRQSHPPTPFCSESVEDEVLVHHADLASYYFSPRETADERRLCAIHATNDRALLVSALVYTMRWLMFCQFSQPHQRVLYVYDNRSDIDDEIVDAVFEHLSSEVVSLDVVRYMFMRIVSVGMYSPHLASLITTVRYLIVDCANMYNVRHLLCRQAPHANAIVSVPFIVPLEFDRLPSFGHTRIFYRSVLSTRHITAATLAFKLREFWPSWCSKMARAASFVDFSLGVGERCDDNCASLALALIVRSSVEYHSDVTTAVESVYAFGKNIGANFSIDTMKKGCAMSSRDAGLIPADNFIVALDQLN